MNNQDRARELLVKTISHIGDDPIEDMVEHAIRKLSVATLIELLRLSLPGYIRDMPEYRTEREDALADG